MKLTINQIHAMGEWQAGEISAWKALRFMILYELGLELWTRDWDGHMQITRAS